MTHLSLTSSVAHVANRSPHLTVWRSTSMPLTPTLGVASVKSAKSPLLDSTKLNTMKRRMVGAICPGYHLTSDDSCFQAFSRVAVPIKSVHLFTDCLTGQSLCYAYVNFFSHYDASKAMYYLNHSYLNGKPMRIMWSQRNPVVRKTGIGNLFVKNLHVSVDSVVLESWFRNFGKVLSCKVVEENGISKGFGFVQFDSEESAMRALDALDGTVLLGNKICVAKFIRKSERPPVSMDLIYTNVYVNNLDENITEDFLQNRFSEYGKAVSVAIKKDIQGKSKGFGFICFESSEDANKAAAALNGEEIGTMKYLNHAALEGKQMWIMWSNRSSVARKTGVGSPYLCKKICVDHKHFEKFNGPNVYAKNLEESIDDMDLQSTFSSCRQIISTRVMCCRNGIHKGFGFVLITMLKGKLLYVAIAQPREDRLAEPGNFSTSCPSYSQPAYSNPFYDPDISSCYDQCVQKRFPTIVSDDQIPMGTTDWLDWVLPLSTAPPTGTWIRTFGWIYPQKSLSKEGNDPSKLKHSEEHACERSDYIHYKSRSLKETEADDWELL